MKCGSILSHISLPKIVPLPQPGAYNLFYDLCLVPSLFLATTEKFFLQNWKDCVILIKHYSAGIVQWQNVSFPSWIWGFDSLYLLQKLFCRRRQKAGVGWTNEENPWALRCRGFSFAIYNQILVEKACRGVSPTARLFCFLSRICCGIMAIQPWQRISAVPGFYHKTKTAAPFQKGVLFWNAGPLALRLLTRLESLKY